MPKFHRHHLNLRWPWRFLCFCPLLEKCWMAFLFWDETCLWQWLYVPSASSSVVLALDSSSSSTFEILQNFYSQESFSSRRWLSLFCTLQILWLHILISSHILNFFLPMLSFNRLNFGWRVPSRQKPLSNAQKSRLTFQVYCSSAPPLDQLVCWSWMQWVHWCQHVNCRVEQCVKLFTASTLPPSLSTQIKQTPPLSHSLAASWNFFCKSAKIRSSLDGSICFFLVVCNHQLLHCWFCSFLEIVSLSLSRLSL